MRHGHDGAPGVRRATAGTVGAIALVALLAPSLFGTGRVAELVEARAGFESAVTEWRRGQATPLSSDRLDAMFARDSVAASVLPEEWSTLTFHQRAQLGDALTVAVRGWVRAHVGPGDGVGTGDLAWVSGNTHETRAVLSYRVNAPQGTQGMLAVEMVKAADGAWQVVDLIRDDHRMTEVYRGRAERALKDYSFAYMVADLQEAEEVVLEDFEAGPIGGLPEGWTWKDSDDKKEKPYAVRQEGDNRFLEARDSGQSVILGKDVRWDLEKYPYVSFRLRVNRVPEGGDERSDKTVDSAAGVYFIYRRRLGLIPESVKYVWSSSLPVGAAVQRNGTGRPWMVVVGTGTDGLGEWRTYVFDLRQAYRDTFGKNPPDRPMGIGILSDANSTRSQAWADYDDIRALRSVETPVGSGVTRFMKPTR